MKIQFEKGKSSDGDFYMLLFEGDKMTTFVYLTPDESKELFELLKEHEFK